MQLRMHVMVRRGMQMSMLLERMKVSKSLMGVCVWMRMYMRMCKVRSMMRVSKRVWMV